MKKKLDLSTWVRKDHFAFFSKFEEPFFGVCVDIDCTRAYTHAKQQGISFFLYYLHCSLAAANAVEPFRYRIIDGEVFVYDEVHASPTINRPDGTFGFAYMNYHPNFDSFRVTAEQEIQKVQESTGLIPATAGQNVMHFSSLPWIKFNSLSHARAFSFPDSVPKVSFGKMTDVDGRKSMPVSLHVHHALMDGFHAGQFIDRFQELMNR